MELNAQVILYPDGRYEVLVEEEKGSGFFIGTSDADLKRLAVAYGEASKKKKEQLAKDVEKSKGLTKKALVKAFLKKVLRKKMASKNSVRILKATIDAATKVLKSWSRALSSADNDADHFWSAVELKMKSADSSSREFEFIRDWFFDVLSHNVSAGRATDYGQAPKDYVEEILSGIYAATKSGGKSVKVWEQDVEPPYSSRVSYEQLEKFQTLFPTMSLEEEATFEDEDEDEEDRPYKYELFVSFPKKK